LKDIFQPPFLVVPCYQYFIIDVQGILTLPISPKKHGNEGNFGGNKNVIDFENRIFSYVFVCFPLFDLQWQKVRNFVSEEG
jgi:hypothetical protein